MVASGEMINVPDQHDTFVLEAPYPNFGKRAFMLLEAGEK
jgi:hypothetical protein